MELAERMRAAMVEAAVAAYQDASVRGLCAEGAFEAAISAMRACDLRQVGGRPVADGSTNSGRPS